MSRRGPLDGYDPLALKWGSKGCTVPLSDRFIAQMNLKRIQDGGWTVEPGFRGNLLITTEKGTFYYCTEFACSCPATTRGLPDCVHRRTIRQANGVEQLRLAVEGKR